MCSVMMLIIFKVCICIYYLLPLVNEIYQSYIMVLNDLSTFLYKDDNSKSLCAAKSYSARICNN